MKSNNSNDNVDVMLSWVLWGAFAVGVATTASGCGVMGVREADLWGAKFTFAEGVDFHIGANQIDRVDNKRGVSPVKTYGKGDSGERSAKERY